MLLLPRRPQHLGKRASGEKHGNEYRQARWWIGGGGVGKVWSWAVWLFWRSAVHGLMRRWVLSMTGRISGRRRNMLEPAILSITAGPQRCSAGRYPGEHCS